MVRTCKIWWAFRIFHLSFQSNLSMNLIRVKTKTLAVATSIAPSPSLTRSSSLSSPPLSSPQGLYPIPIPNLVILMAAANAISAAASLTAATRLLPPATSISSTLRFFARGSGRSLKTLSSPPVSLRPLLNNKSTSAIRFSASTAAPASTSTISVGDKLPESTLSYFDSAGELQTVTVSDLTKGKKVILFAVPGAFTPTCSQKHLPGFVDKAGELKSKGVDTIVCISVNDAFVMKAWKENLSIGDEVLMLSDGNGQFTRALGVELDLSDKPVGLGVRSRRYALLADDGVVKVLNLEEGGAFTFSSAEDMLKAL